MASLVTYGAEFDGHVANGLAPQAFNYRLLAEGDSWMDRSAMFHTSLLQALAPKLDEAGGDALIVNLSRAGDTLCRIGQIDTVEFRQWVETAFAWKFDAILLSAGGNDFIDAARDPGPGKGILKNLDGALPPAQGADCLNRDAIKKLVANYLNPSFAALYQTVQSSRHKNIPIFLNCYDTPTARNAPAFPGGRSWLYEAFTKNKVPAKLWPQLTDAIFAEIKSAVDGWAKVRSDVIVVPTTGTLSPAASDALGNSGDWLNEIHPNASGWDKLGSVWRDTILGRLRT